MSNAKQVHLSRGVKAEAARRLGIKSASLGQAFERGQPKAVEMVWKVEMEFRAKRAKTYRRMKDLAEAETIRWHKEQQDNAFGPEYETFTK